MSVEREESPTGLKALDDCPAASRERKPQTQAMLMGIRRHEIIEHYYLTGEWQKDPDFEEVNVAIAVAQAKDGFLVPRDWLLDVEARHVPGHVQVEMYGRKLLRVAVVPGVWALRLAGDATWMHPDIDDIVNGDDFKGVSARGEDHTIQAGAWFYAYSEVFPARKYVWRAKVPATGETIAVLEYTLDQRDEIAEMLSAVVARKREYERTGVWPEKLNRWCSSCPRRDRCATYQAALANPASIVPVEQGNNLPETFPDLAALRTKVRAAKAMFEDLGDQVETAVKERLEGGPILLDGTEWSVIQKTRRYDVDIDPALRLLGDLGLPIEAAVEVNHKGYEQAVVAHLGKLKREKAPGWEQLSAEIKERFEASRKARKSPEVRVRNLKEASA